MLERLFVRFSENIFPKFGPMSYLSKYLVLNIDNLISSKEWNLLLIHINIKNIVLKCLSNSYSFNSSLNIWLFLFSTHTIDIRSPHPSEILKFTLSFLMLYFLKSFWNFLSLIFGFFFQFIHLPLTGWIIYNFSLMWHHK